MDFAAPLLGLPPRQSEVFTTGEHPNIEATFSYIKQLALTTGWKSEACSRNTDAATQVLLLLGAKSAGTAIHFDRNCSTERCFWSQ